MNGLCERNDAIKLAYSEKPCLYPNLVEDPDIQWKNEKPIECRGQGYWLNPEDEDEEYEDEYEE